jgi:CRISPR-associated protein Cas1
VATVYLTEQGSTLSKIDQRLIVSRGDETLDEIPLINVDQVVVMGKGVRVTTPAVFALARRGVELVYLTQRGGYVTRTRGKDSKFGQLRFRQALMVNDPAATLSVAREMVRGKLLNQKALVQGLAGRSGHRGVSGITRMIDRLNEATNLDVLRGFEGQGAAVYFHAFRRLLSHDMGFRKRVYYPPTDPVNAALSFGYTLLLNQLVGAVQVVGLDPYLGFFHVVDYGRPSLALDLEEEFRPVIVDRLVLDLVNRQELTPRHFTRPTGRKKAVYLSDEGRRIFIEAYETRVNSAIVYPPTGKQNTFRRCFELQARQVARIVLGKAKKYRALVVASAGGVKR